ncbi:MAG: glycosyltransferase family 9 protein [Candidatus Omnitrophota bacterium]|nr:glycosyltransferase family 9 protein [Candidatus Omnitrophota bacterium]
MQGQEQADKALILNLGGLGNTILIYPLVKALREQKDYGIKVVVNEKVVYELVKALGFSDEEVLSLRFEPAYLIGKIFDIRREKIGTGITAAYTNWIKSWIFFTATGVKRKISTIPGIFSFLVDKGVSEPLLHEYEVHRKFADYLGLRLPLYPEIDIEEDKEFTEGFFRENNINNDDIIIGMHAGSGQRQASFRRWPIARFASLIDLANRELGAQVILIGGSNEKDLVGQLAETGVKFVSSVGRTDFHQLASLMGKCDIVVGNDSGLMHFAASLGVPVVAIFGPTDYRKTCPVSKHVRIVRKGIKCSPCYKRGRVKCKRMECFSLIEPEEVFAKVKELLIEAGCLS